MNPISNNPFRAMIQPAMHPRYWLAPFGFLLLGLVSGNESVRTHFRSTFMENAYLGKRKGKPLDGSKSSP